ncbi:MAG: HdeD family acid-resistance protein [Sulfuriferula sp.]
MDPTWIDAQAKRFGNHTLTVGVLLIILGLIGILVPVVLSIITATLIGWLLILGGAFWGWHAFKHGAGTMDWIKSALLLVTGILLLVKPVTGVASIALLLSLYLFMDAFASISLADRTLIPKVRGWMFFNGIVDILLGVLFLIGWPNSSLWMVGMFIGISLLFDGWALTVIGWSIRQPKP